MALVAVDGKRRQLAVTARHGARRALCPKQRCSRSARNTVDERRRATQSPPQSLASGSMNVGSRNARSPRAEFVRGAAPRRRKPTCNACVPAESPWTRGLDQVQAGLQVATVGDFGHHATALERITMAGRRTEMKRFMRAQPKPQHVLDVPARERRGSRQRRKRVSHRRCVPRRTDARGHYRAPPAQADQQSWPRQGPAG